LSSPNENETDKDPRLEFQRLRYDYDMLLRERNQIAGEISSLGEALSECQKQRTELESELRRIRNAEVAPSFGEATSNRISYLEQEVNTLSGTNITLESLLFRSLVNEPNIKATIRDFILKQGSVKYRILLLLSEKGAMQTNEIAKIAGLDLLTMRQVIENLSEEHSIEVHGSLLTTPGMLRPPPAEKWRTLNINNLFDEVDEYLSFHRNSEIVAQTLQTLKDNIEQKVRIRGTYIFEIGKEIQEWRRGTGNLEQLRYKLRDWKSKISQ
jgi:uncharacterized protein YukE